MHPFVKDPKQISPWKKIKFGFESKNMELFHPLRLLELDVGFTWKVMFASNTYKCANIVSMILACPWFNWFNSHAFACNIFPLSIFPTSSPKWLELVDYDWPCCNSRCNWEQWSTSLTTLWQWEHCNYTNEVWHYPLHFCGHLFFGWSPP
jgi:hypothetical protein